MPMGWHNVATGHLLRGKPLEVLGSAPPLGLQAGEQQGAVVEPTHTSLGQEHDHSWARQAAGSQPRCYPEEEILTTPLFFHHRGQLWQQHLLCFASPS